MANTFAPTGFSQYRGQGSLPTYEQVEAAILSTSTTPLFFGDPVVQSASATGVGTGYIQQAYGPITLTVAATAITTNATTGALTVTFTAITSTSGNVPNGGFGSGLWAPPIGSTLIIQGATMSSGNLNGTFTVTSSTYQTAVCANAGSTINAASTASGTCTIVVPIAGVFVGCKYLSTANKNTVWRNYAPGSDYNGDVTGYVINDPNAQFEVMTGNSNTTATAVGLANVGNNISFNYLQNGLTTVNGNTANGISTMFADQYSLIANSSAGATINAFLPFRIIGLKNYLIGGTSPLASINGNDSTTAYNRIIVGFNNAGSRQLFGI